MIAIDQDKLGKAGMRVSPKGSEEVWLRSELEDGSAALVLFYKGNGTATDATSVQMSVTFADLGLAKQQLVRDVINHRDLGSMESITADVELHGVQTFRLTPSDSHRGRTPAGSRVTQRI